MQPPPDEGPGTVSSPPEEDADRFDPGVETGYLRRTPREGPPDVELGAHPFEPGDGVGYDDRRARRSRRRRVRELKLEEEAREAELRDAADTQEMEALRRKEEADEAEEAERLEEERRAEAEAADRERHEAQLSRLEEAERRLEEDEQYAVEEAERARREAAEQERAEREARARAGHEQAERESEAKERRRRAAEAQARMRNAKAEQVPKPRRKPSAKPRPALKHRARRPARPMPAPGAEARSAGAPKPAAAPPATPPAVPGLAAPTAKLAAVAAAVAGAALLLGSVAGLPTPFGGAEGGVSSLNAQGVPVGSGIAASLYRGPFHPVRGEYDYGERGAQFGADRGGRKHAGQDIFSKRGTPLVAVRDGIVVDRAKENSTYSGGRGNYVAIYSPIEDRSYVYLHMLEPAVVEKGERVHAGQLLGLMGCTGSCFGTHLHFEVRRGRAAFAADTKAIDPRAFVDELPQAPQELEGG